MRRIRDDIDLRRSSTGGAAALAAEGRIGDRLAAALKAEARRRAATGQFFATSPTPAW